MNNQTIRAVKLAELDNWVGSEFGVSEWLLIDQERINQFADCTRDHQWIHVDPERAKQDSPFGVTIAHGFLTLSLLCQFQADLGIFPEDAKQVINYGLNKVRFLSPVKVGERVRARVTISGIEEKKNGARLITLSNTVEIEGGDAPALIAETLLLALAE